MNKKISQIDQERPPIGQPGERALLIALLSNLIADLNMEATRMTEGNNMATRERSAARIRQEAKDYILSQSTDPFGFRWICDILGFDSRNLGNKLLNTSPRRFKFRVIYTQGEKE